jgi:hypothetical protein
LTLFILFFKGDKGQHLKLRTFAVVAIGFERLLWEEIT